MNPVMPDLSNIRLDKWTNPLFVEQNIQANVLRLDKIHPYISGNKWFKLKYYIEKATTLKKSHLVSCGGAYSNHLVALAVAANALGFRSTGLVRGEESESLSHSLKLAADQGMELRFITRREYDLKKNDPLSLGIDERDTAYLWIPEGGAGPEGVRGSGEILNHVNLSEYSHIVCALGTGTTMAGIINSSGIEQQKIGISVLKGTQGFEPMQLSWINDPAALQNVHFVHEFHGGGYAKKSPSLIDFMNSVYRESGIPTDFVYTGKLFHAIIQMLTEKAFKPGSRLLILHTGGLQGNYSLNPGLLEF